MKDVKVSSKIDLRSGYRQVHIKEEAIHKIEFKTWYGHYEFTMVPFGLINALATFICLMKNIFIKYLDKFVLVLLDDHCLFLE